MPVLKKGKKKILLRHLTLLKVLDKLSDKEREKIIPFLNNDACSNISECVLNILHGSHLNKSAKSKLKDELKGSQKQLRYIANPKKPIHLRKKRMEQSGGALGVILATILPIIANLVIERLTKKT